MNDQVGIVVNYYRRNNHPLLTRDFTLLALRFLRQDNDENSIVLVDGSPESDSDLRSACALLRVNYLHTGKQLSFAEGFNVGWQYLGETYVCLMANDILVPVGTVKTLQEYLRISDVGCVFPYLSYCDYPGQTYSFVRKPITCEPSAMTLNLNIFKRSVLEKAMGIDESFSGCYNDIILLKKIRSLGYRVVLVGSTNVFHLGQMTISNGSTYAKEKDVKKFSQEYRSFHTPHGIWGVAHWKWPLATTQIASLLWRLSENAFSYRLRRWSHHLMMRYEPELTKFPARNGKAKRAISAE